MFKFSSKAEVNKQFKLADLFKTIKADKEVKAAAVNVQSVTLTHVLSAATTGLEPSENMREIYFIEMHVTTKRVPAELIRQMDKTILFQTVYTVRYGSETKYVFTYKTIDAGKSTFMKHRESEWLDKIEIKDLPLTTRLDGVFQAVSRFVTGLAYRQGESIRENLARLQTIEKYVADIEKTQRMIATEIQPREKLALHERLKKIVAEKERMEK